MMGRRMRDFIAGKKEQGSPELRKAIRGKLEEVMKIDDMRNQAAMKTRMNPQMLERWMAYCKVDSPDDIDYADPCVYIEWSACDPAVYGMADDADAFIEETRCDREVYMAHYWPGTPGA